MSDSGNNEDLSPGARIVGGIFGLVIIILFFKYVLFADWLNPFWEWLFNMKF